MERTIDFENLRWVKLYNPEIIPQKLIEEIRGRTYSVEEFYEYQKINKENPGNLLYAIADNDNKIRGYLWAEMNALDESLFINTFSIDKEYWNKGEAIDFAIEFLRDLKDKIKARFVYWMTTNSRFFMKKGFKESKHHLMIYEGEEEDGTEQGQQL